jgi:hypothetical protein
MSPSASIGRTVFAVLADFAVLTEFAVLADFAVLTEFAEKELSCARASGPSAA